MSESGDLKRYQAAIRTLEEMGLEATDFVDKSQKTIADILRGRLRSFDLNKAKAIVTSRENFAIAAACASDAEKILQDEFIPAGRSFLADLEQRAYKAGTAWGAAQAANSGAPGYIFRGVDAETLRLIRVQMFELVSAISQAQVDYIRRTLTGAVLENHVWDITMERMIQDGRVPALKITDRNGVEKVIDMQTRVQTIVRTETGKIAELGSYDKSKEIWGEDELFGEWNTIGDANVRDKHAERAGEVRSAKDWETVPHPSDGRVLLPGRDPNCRCWMKWGPREAFADKLGPATEPVKTPTKAKPSAPAGSKVAAKPTAKPKAAPAAKKPVDYSKPRPPLKTPAINDADDLFNYVQKDLDLCYGDHFHDFKGMNKKALGQFAEGLSRAVAQFKMKFQFIQGKGAGNAHAVAYRKYGSIRLNRSYFNAPEDGRIGWTAPNIAKRVQLEANHVAFLKDDPYLKDWATSNKPAAVIRRKQIADAELHIAALKELKRYSVSSGMGFDSPINTIIHEYGHHVLWRAGAQVEKEWTSLFNSASLVDKYKISEYAAYSADEMFAECFSAWTWGEKIDSPVYKRFVEIIEDLGKNWDKIYKNTMPAWELNIGDGKAIPFAHYWKFKS